MKESAACRNHKMKNMKCKEFEKNIYLHSELSEPERNQLQHHLDSCSSCRQLFLSAQMVQNKIRHVAMEKEEIRHPELLTQRIMREIASQEIKLPLIDLVSGYFQERFIKYSFAVVSVILVLASASEFFNSSMQLEIETTQAADASVILDSRLFRETFSKQKDKRHRTELTECSSPLMASPRYLECLRSKMK